MSLPLPHKCPKLGIDGSNEDYQRYANFLALLAIIAGSDDFMKKIQTPISYVKQQTYIRDTDKGVIFVGNNKSGHFHYRDPKSQQITDSYEEEWQCKNTHGFCQTFAILGYHGLTNKLKPNKFVENTRVILKFLKTKTEFLEKYWKRTVQKHQKYIFFIDDELDAEEIGDDIDCVLATKNREFINHWIDNEFTYK